MRAVKTILSFSFLFLAASINAGDKEVSNELPDEIKNLDKKKILRPLEPNLYEYPSEATTNKDYSDVWVKFKVNKNGRAEEISTVYCDTPNNGFESAALKTVSGSSYSVKTKIKRRKKTIDKSWFYTKVRFQRNFDRTHLYSDSITIDIVRDNPLCPDYLSVMPEIIHKAAPKYPRNARQNYVEGTVFLRLLISKTGIPINVKVVKSSGSSKQYGLEEAALSAARKCKFSPMLCDGIPVKVWVSFPYEFILHR